MSERRRDVFRERGSESAPPPNAPSPPPAPPVGQENWLDYIEQQARKAGDLQSRGQIVELYKAAIAAEPGSLSLWLAYCEYFWTLYYSSRHPSQPSLARPWPPDELPRAREIFSLDSALHLWQEAHEATRYRLSDSHELWNRWIGKEMELLAHTKTPEGVKRITQLFRNRLMLPHATWAETSAAFSSFLSEYNHTAWEDAMKDITSRSQLAREVYEKREPYELRLRSAATAGGADLAAQQEVMKDYLQFEIKNTVREKKNVRLAIQLSLGLFSRALTGVLASDEATWADYVVLISTLNHRFSSAATRDPDMLQVIPSSFSVLQVAVQHCAWSGRLWARYILSGEEAGLSFSAMERIKHAATDSSQLERNGMVPVIEMYAAWCGYLKRSAMEPTATEEMTDVADSGLLAALEAVEVTGRRLFGNAYVGDPDFRLERILIGYLTEKHGATEEARARWLGMAELPLYSASYNFWGQYYIWELSVYQAEKGRRRSPTPGTIGGPPVMLARQRPPSLATEVLQRALKQKDLDWPERIMEVYIQHCTDHETPERVRLAYDFLHRTRKLVEQRRRDEAAAAATTAKMEPSWMTEDSQQVQKRKRGEEDFEGANNKRIKNAKDVADSLDSLDAGGNGSASHAWAAPEGFAEGFQEAKRDREHTSVIVTNLPADATQTRVRQYFREFGHINSIVFRRVDDGRSAVALIEFRTPAEASSALLRDGKYYDTSVISVRPGTGLVLWVTNFPPTADDAYIRRIFRDRGEILDIRWPSLKANTHRRFCYVAFREQDAARKAAELDGLLVEGRYKLQAKLSDPSQRKAREGATSEGREVKVRGLMPRSDDNAVREMFARFGTVQTVRLLRGSGGQSQGIAFVVFETKEEAERSVAELNGAKFHNSILSVEIAKASNFKPVARTGAEAASTSPLPTPSGLGLESTPPLDSGEGGGNVFLVSDEPVWPHGRQDAFSVTKEERSQRTFALLGIPDTVNDTRVRALVEKHCGSRSAVAKIVLRPDHGGATVEMADQAAAGKAMLALAGIDVDGRAIRTGSVADLMGEKAEIRTDRIDVGFGHGVNTVASSGAGRGVSSRVLPPSRINAPSGLGKQIPKRGPGFPKPVAASVRELGDQARFEEHGTVPGAITASKSNSQFRDLFLGPKAEVKATQCDKAHQENSGATS